MKEQKLYVCDHCGTQYKEKLQCQKCEKNHKIKLEIIAKRYLSINADASGFPVAITIQDENGRERIYHI